VALAEAGFEALALVPPDTGVGGTGRGVGFFARCFLIGVGVDGPALASSAMGLAGTEVFTGSGLS